MLKINAQMELATDRPRGKIILYPRLDIPMPGTHE